MASFSCILKVSAFVYFLFYLFFLRGQLLCNLGDCLTPELQNCLPIMLDRLRNEITRLTAVKALIMITNSPLKLDIMFILKEAVPLLATFLRKNHRGLKLSTLTCLDIIIRQYGIVILVLGMVLQWFLNT